jgi:RNA polymerase sigma-32 factor
MSTALTTTKNFAAISIEQGSSLVKYIREISKFPLLTAEEELFHSKNFKDNLSQESAKILIQSHLRLVVKIAYKFRGYGLSMLDIIAEGNLGLMHALKKYNPDKGFRFSTYAMLWIKANIQEFLLKSWSLVKIGTTSSQRKIFFNLQKIKRVLLKEKQNISAENMPIIAKNLGVSVKELQDMESRLTLGDVSLNQLVDEDGGDEMIDFIESNSPNQEEIYSGNQQKNMKQSLFNRAFATLSDREQDIVSNRHLVESPLTLEDLSRTYNISKERIRQIEANAINKIKKFVANPLNTKQQIINV